MHNKLALSLVLGGLVAAAGAPTGALAMAGYATDAGTQAVVRNSYDECWETMGKPTMVPVECGGAAPVSDSDGDGVVDDQDQCPNTPAGVTVDADGCPLDDDGDGVPNYQDRCPGTPAGVVVDEQGCPRDDDGDGVPNYRDRCPDTPAGAPVDQDGCQVSEKIVLRNVLFGNDSARLSPAGRAALDEAVPRLQGAKVESVMITGHTDSRGPDAYNMGLSERRANAVSDYLVSQGVAADMLTTRGAGEANPVASNATREGRAQNRRVEIDVKVK
jgi:OOP family OmpA-OmpF porin